MGACSRTKLHSHTKSFGTSELGWLRGVPMNIGLSEFYPLFIGVLGEKRPFRSRRG